MTPPLNQVFDTQEVTTDQIFAILVQGSLVVGLVYLAMTALTIGAMWAINRIRGNRRTDRLWLAGVAAPIATAVLAPVLFAPKALEVMREPRSLDPNFTGVDIVLSQMPEGSVLLNVPDRVEQFSPFSVNLTVATADFAESIRQLYKREKMSEPNEMWSTVPLSPVMKARISGIDFRFISPDEVEFLVPSQTTASWTWEASGVWPGERNIKVQLFALVKHEGVEREHRVFSQSRPVKVDLNPTELLIRRWDWIATNLVLPALGAVIAFLIGLRTLTNKAPPPRTDA